MAGYGLCVRWSLSSAGPELAEKLREYVVGTSLPRFATLPGLRTKTWRMRPGEWFEGSYIWADAQARDAFAASFAATGAENPASQLIGAGPEWIEPFEVVAVAEGPAGFLAGPGPGVAAS